MYNSNPYASFQTSQGPSSSSNQQSQSQQQQQQHGANQYNNAPSMLSSYQSHTPLQAQSIRHPLQHQGHQTQQQQQQQQNAQDLGLEGLMDTGVEGTVKKNSAGGRPRDRIWELFNGDRNLATCSFCSWKTEHPKAFRMRAHILNCDSVPSDKRRMVELLQESKDDKAKGKSKIGGGGAGEDDIVMMTDPVLSGLGGLGGLGVGSSAGQGQQQGPGQQGGNQHGGVTGGVAPRMMETPKPPAKRTKKEPKMAAKSPITCHVLDSTCGKPAQEVQVRLDVLDTKNSGGFTLMAQGQTDVDGRCSNLLPGGSKIESGIYKITFFTTEYFTKRSIISFYPFVEISFEVKNPDEHYHIPLLLAPYSFTTYRGS